MHLAIVACNHPHPIVIGGTEAEVVEHLDPQAHTQVFVERAFQLHLLTQTLLALRHTALADAEDESRQVERHLHLHEAAEADVVLLQEGERRAQPSGEAREASVGVRIDGLPLLLPHAHLSFAQSVVCHGQRQLVQLTVVIHPELFAVHPFLLAPGLLGEQAVFRHQTATAVVEVNRQEYRHHCQHHCQGAVERTSAQHHLVLGTVGVLAPASVVGEELQLSCQLLLPVGAGRVFRFRQLTDGRLHGADIAFETCQTPESVGNIVPLAQPPGVDECLAEAVPFPVGQSVLAVEECEAFVYPVGELVIVGHGCPVCLGIQESVHRSEPVAAGTLDASAEQIEMSDAHGVACEEVKVAEGLPAEGVGEVILSPFEEVPGSNLVAQCLPFARKERPFESLQLQPARVCRQVGLPSFQLRQPSVVPLLHEGTHRPHCRHEEQHTPHVCVYTPA
ncbi:unknown [Bacteroides sp. CAG:462]|nr:unknown [Bacteroides sp. CAG:462]